MDLDIEGNGEGIQSMEAGRKHREAFEKWKRNRGFGAGWVEVNPIKREETIQESSQDTGRRMERRKTYEAWKKGVVPPLNENEKRDNIGRDEDFEVAEMPDSGVQSEGFSLVRTMSEDEAPRRFGEVEGGKKQKQVAVDDSPTRSKLQSGGFKNSGIQIGSRGIEPL